MLEVTFWLSMLVLIILHATVYRQYRTDLLRQRIFNARDDLFLSAADGNIPFDSDAYIMTRETLNGMLRYAHSLSVMDIVFAAIFRKLVKTNHQLDPTEEYFATYRRALSVIPENELDVIKKCILEMHLAVLVHLLTTSYLVIFAVPAKVLVQAFSGPLKRNTQQARVVSKMKRPFALIDAKALSFGKEDKNTVVIA